MLKIDQLINAFYKAFPHHPTKDQVDLLQPLAAFLLDKYNNSIFVINGYAGTGKTSIISALVKIIGKFYLKSVLLAPTGRSAKVMGNYSGKQAFTIHKKIYRIITTSEGNVRLAMNHNMHKDTVFIVDEASMINDNASSPGKSIFSNQNLLTDLVEYVHNSQNCKLILLGDMAQLPPVKAELSPALNKQYLQSRFSYDIDYHELKEVVRQAKNSGILYNATRLRNILDKEKIDTPQFELHDFDDIINIDGTQLEEELNTAFSGSEKEGTLIICRSNKRANVFNQEIRKRILFQEGEIQAGDYMMVVRNNYFWLEDNSQAGFIANGDIIEILKISGYKDLYGLRFAEVTIRLVDYPNENDLDVIIMLDTIMSEKPALTYEENRAFFEEVLQDFSDIKNRKKQIENVKNNPYFNALQVKFAYALTCHKSQGGQWESVFVDQGFLSKEMINREYIRWLYTAFTRATKKLFLVNFNEMFFR